MSAPLAPTTSLPRRRRLGRARRLAGSAALLLAATGCPGRVGPASGPSVREAPPVKFAPASDADSKLEPGFRAILEEDPGAHVRAIVDLREQVDLVALDRRLRAEGRGKAWRRAAVVGALERVAERQHAALRPELDRMIREARLDYARPVAIVSRLLVEGPASGILELAQRPEIAGIVPEWTSERHRGRQAEGAGPVLEGGEFTSWAIAAMGADALWKRGLTGRGVVVATIDTGAYRDHEQLAGRALDGGRGWFDPVMGRTRPYDSHGHGTGVLSLAVGGNPDGRIVGVAPEARWAAALGNWRNYYSRWRMSEAADWILRVVRPDVLINAWSNDREECDAFDLPFIDAWKASGIFVVFPAGNAGPADASGESPASLAGAFPDGGPVLSVAALAPGGELYPLSSRGPSRCGSPAFPSLAAPGGDLPLASVSRPTAYHVGSGTSLAAGLVGGAAALLLQADPELTPDELEALLTSTALDLPPPGRDDRFGAGSVDLPAALAAVRARAGASPGGTEGRR